MHMAKYGKKAHEEVKKAIHKTKRGQTKERQKGKAKSRKQAIAIGLSKARKKGAKVPPKKEIEEKLGAGIPVGQTFLSAVYARGADIRVCRLSAQPPLCLEFRFAQAGKNACPTIGTAA